jgi:hypothetical protein
MYRGASERDKQMASRVHSRRRLYSISWRVGLVSEGREEEEKELVLDRLKKKGSWSSSRTGLRHHMGFKLVRDSASRWIVFQRRGGGGAPSLRALACCS